MHYYYRIAAASNLHQHLSPAGVASYNTKEERFNKAFDALQALLGPEKFTKSVKV